jgi:alginate O-acetyltransferase complex protein AlgI
VLINITWVFFRAKDFGVAAKLLTSMAGQATNPIPMIAALPMLYAMVIVAGIVGTHWAMRDKTLEIAVERTPAWLVGGILALMAVAIIAEQGKGSAFIYFQF